ncbi:hypothetical protein OAO18_00930 [Francisellaceae bacterium]|nr:hypothetical protein [Francisellaceae bacterium]
MFKLNKYTNLLTIVTMLTAFNNTTYASSKNDLTVDGVGLISDSNEKKRLPTWKRFYNIQGLTDIKTKEKVEKISQFQENKFQVTVSSRSGYKDTLSAQNNFQVFGGESGETNFAIWGKMSLAGYPFLGLIDISQHHMHTNNYWQINSNADTGFYKMHASYYDLVFRTSNHYKYNFDGNGSSHNHITIQAFKDSFNSEEQMLEMEMPFVHLTSMPEGYYLTEDQAKSKGFNFKSLNKGEKWFSEHQMVVIKPNGEEFYFQTCMPQSNLIYNEKTQELSCEYPSGLPEKIPGCSAIYYFADGKASMYCNDGLLNGHVNPNQSSGKWKTYFKTSKSSLYNCKVGSIKADKTDGITCEIDTTVNQPYSGYDINNKQSSKIKMLPNMETFER